MRGTECRGNPGSVSLRASWRGKLISVSFRAKRGGDLGNASLRASWRGKLISVSFRAKRGGDLGNASLRASWRGNLLLCLSRQKRRFLASLGMTRRFGLPRSLGSHAMTASDCFVAKRRGNINSMSSRGTECRGDLMPFADKAEIPRFARNDSLRGKNAGTHTVCVPRFAQ